MVKSYEFFDKMVTSNKQQVSKKQADVLLTVMTKECFDLTYEYISVYRKFEGLINHANNNCEDLLIRLDNSLEYKESKVLRTLIKAVRGTGEKVNETTYDYTISHSNLSLLLSLLKLNMVDLI